MSTPTSTSRPEYISPDWMRCTDGMAFALPPPAGLQSDEMLSNPNAWERLACIVLQAQSGNFSNVGKLLELAEKNPDDHLRDVAIEVFAMAAPSAELKGLLRLLEHPDGDTRTTAYGAVVKSATLELAAPLARRLSRVERTERDPIMYRLSDMLEVEQDDLEFAESRLSDEAYFARVDDTIDTIVEAYGGNTAIFRAAPLDANALVAAIAELCAEEDAEELGGAMFELFAMLEGMTGWSYAGCFDDDCFAILPRVSYVLNSLQQSGKLDALEPGRRYFFGHPVP